MYFYYVSNLNQLFLKARVHSFTCSHSSLQPQNKGNTRARYEISPLFSPQLKVGLKVFLNFSLWRPLSSPSGVVFCFLFLPFPSTSGVRELSMYPISKGSSSSIVVSRRPPFPPPLFCFAVANLQKVIQKVKLLIDGGM